LPGHLGIVITHVGELELKAELAVGEMLMAPNGFLHAGTIVTLADTCAGYGCIVNLPPGATCQDAGRGLPTASSIATPYNAPVAQLDRVSASEAEGRGFESRRAHFSTKKFGNSN